MKTKTALIPPQPALAPGAAEPTEAEIQKEAYYLWLEQGRPQGRDLEFWDAARELLRHRASHGRGPLLTGIHFLPSAAMQHAVPTPPR